MESTLNCQCSAKNMRVICQIFQKFLTPKDVLFLMQNRNCFYKPFASELVDTSLKLLKSEEKYFYPTFSSFFTNLSLKKLFSIRSESLGLLVKTLTANYEYSPSNRENLLLQIQIKLSKKPYWLLRYFFLIFGIYSKFSMFWKEMSVIGQIYLKLYTPEDALFWLHKSYSFWKPFGSERVNESQKLLKSAEKYFYLTFSSFWAKLSLKSFF